MPQSMLVEHLEHGVPQRSAGSLLSLPATWVLLACLALQTLSKLLLIEFLDAMVQVCL